MRTEIYDDNYYIKNKEDSEICIKEREDDLHGR